MTTAAPLIPPGAGLDQLRDRAATCTACDLYANATQTVFGAGPPAAPLMLVGEQPGDQEDRRGQPFVGPAGGLLTAALAEAGIDPEATYLTNVVKHFGWRPSGKRRLHQKPNVAQVRACRPWLDAEIEAVAPRVLVCLGATAAQALLGPRFKVSEQRGTLVDWDREPLVLATVHPSSILRAADNEARRTQRASFVSDLKVAAAALRGSP